MSKQTSPALSTLSARVLNGYQPTRAEILSMAGSLLSQDETRGQSMNHLTESAESLWADVVAGLEGEGFTYNRLTETMPAFLSRALGDGDGYLTKSVTQLLAELNSHFGGGTVSHLEMGFAELLSTLAATLGGVGGGDNWWDESSLVDIDFVNNRAWTAADGEVAIDTLLGSDPNTENAYGPTSYSSDDLNEFGYSSSFTPDPAFIGTALPEILSGSTIRFAFTIPVTDQGTISYYIVSAVGDNAVYFEATAGSNRVEVGSYGGSAAGSKLGAMNSGAGNENNVLAITATPTRGEFSVNGSEPVEVVFDESDWPSGQLVAALVDPSATAPAALQSITIYAPLPDATGLPALSAVA